MLLVPGLTVKLVPTTLQVLPIVHVPGPKFDTVEEAIEIIADLRSDHEKVKALALEQYNFVIENYSYKVLAKEWLSVMRSSFQNLSS